MQGGSTTTQNPQGLRGSHYFDLDTGLWYRTTNLRPNSSSLELNYYSTLDIALGAVQEASHFGSYVDVLECSNMTWRRVTVSDPAPPYIFYDSTQFICGGLFVVALHSQANTPAIPTQFWALKISDIAAQHWRQRQQSTNSLGSESHRRKLLRYKQGYIRSDFVEDGSTRRQRCVKAGGHVGHHDADIDRSCHWCWQLRLLKAAVRTGHFRICLDNRCHQLPGSSNPPSWGINDNSNISFCQHST